MTPDWLNSLSTDDEDGAMGVFKAPNGTWAVHFHFWLTRPILNVPTRELAIDISRALREAEKSGAQSYADQENG